MKKILLLILIFTILMTGCSSGKYYIYQTESKIDLQPTKDNFLPYMYVPKGKHIVIKESRSTVKKAQYGSHKGYICGTYNLSNPIQISSKDIKHLTFNSTDSTYYFKGKRIDFTESIKTKSSYSPSRSTGTGRVQVKGYYRKDGTYVRPHTRKSPTKRK